MDPNAILMMWAEAVLDGEVEAANEAHACLMTWMLSGGYEPRWVGSAGTREAFFGFGLTVLAGEST
jgi:hypothetical protein